jgi:ATP-dependent DNA helicase RecQ
LWEIVAGWNLLTFDLTFFCFSMIKEVLYNKFGYKEFRNHQQAVIETILAKKDCFVLMPTGGGKSLCYQIPAIVFDGLTIVISPLIALMKDQVDALRVNGIPAAYLNSTLDKGQQLKVIEKLRNREYKLLYIAPERIFANGRGFIDFLKSIKVSLFAIDEAHCISQWGHDFRPEYLQLGLLKKEFPEIPVAGFTATADHQTRKDILDKLNLNNPSLFVSSFNRPNISYFVEPKKGAKARLLEFLQEHMEDSGIIYTLSRNSADSIAEELRANGFSALSYHAGLTNEHRASNQSKFLRDEAKIMVATIAFGMGINKSNVRYVVHMDMPKNIEGYYQETGRAGRDGLSSKALMFFTIADLIKLKRFIEIDGNESQTSILFDKLNKMADFAQSKMCRRKFLLNYFGEDHPGNCESCDYCLNENEKFDGTVIAQKALSAVSRLKESFGVNYIIEFLRGSQSEKIKAHHKELKTYGAGADISKDSWQNYFRELIQNEYLLQTPGDYPVLKITAKGLQVLKGHEKLFLTQAVLPKIQHTDAPEYEKELYERLKKIRYKIAQEENVPAYVIFSDATLVELATYLPLNNQELSTISGFGALKLGKYGADFLKQIVAYCTINNIPGRMKMKATSGKNRKESSQTKVPTRSETYKLYKEGLNVAEISRKRGLAVSTIESHLAELVFTGELLVEQLVSTEKADKIISEFKRLGSEKLAPVKEALGENFTYVEIKAAQAYYKRSNSII